MTRLPDPALVVLVGASGAGKSHWAAQRYRPQEVVSSDALRSVVGSGPHDLDASDEAFALLETIVAARLRRGLGVVVDTLGLDPGRRRGWQLAARAAGLPAVVVHLDTPPPECRRRNRLRDVPVPAAALTAQLRRAREAAGQLAGEGWDRVETVSSAPSDAPVAAAPDPSRATRQAAPHGDDERRSSQGLRVVLQLSRFPWGEDPAAWLTGVVDAADRAGFAGIALMDHLIQIPQVDRAWAPIPEPWVTLGLLAAADTRLQLGTLVTPVTLRPAGVTAKAAATLDVLTGGRAFVGVGAGWWAREHAGFGIPFPAAGERLDALARGIETMRALWATGTRAYDGARVSLPETTCYPRPAGRLPVYVGGGGERRTLRIAAELADGCNVPSDLDTVRQKTAVLHRHCHDVGRDPTEVAVTVLDLPTTGRDRDEVWTRVERHRGRTPAAEYARRTHAGTIAEQRDRYGALAAAGVDTVFVAVRDLEGPEDVVALAGLTG